MSVTRLPPPAAPKLRLIETQSCADDWQFDRAFAALDQVALINRDVMMAACILKSGDVLGPGTAVVDGETLRTVLQVALKVVELGGAANRDLTVTAAIRHWLQENGE